MAGLSFMPGGGGTRSVGGYNELYRPRAPVGAMPSESGSAPSVTGAYSPAQEAMKRLARRRQSAPTPGANDMPITTSLPPLSARPLPPLPPEMSYPLPPGIREAMSPLPLPPRLLPQMPLGIPAPQASPPPVPQLPPSPVAPVPEYTAPYLLPGYQGPGGPDWAALLDQVREIQTAPVTASGYPPGPDALALPPPPSRPRPTIPDETGMAQDGPGSYARVPTNMTGSVEQAKAYLRQQIEPVLGRPITDAEFAEIGKIAGYTGGTTVTGDIVNRFLMEAERRNVRPRDGLPQIHQQDDPNGPGYQGGPTVPRLTIPDERGMAQPSSPRPTVPDEHGPPGGTLNPEGYKRVPDNMSGTVDDAKRYLRQQIEPVLGRPITDAEFAEIGRKAGYTGGKVVTGQIVNRFLDEAERQLAGYRA